MSFPIKKLKFLIDSMALSDQIKDCVLTDCKFHQHNHITFLGNIFIPPSPKHAKMIRATISPFTSTIRRDDITVDINQVSLTYNEQNDLFTEEEIARYQIVNESESWERNVEFWNEYTDSWDCDYSSHTEYYTPKCLINYFRSKYPDQEIRNNINVNKLSHKCEAGAYYERIFETRYPLALEKKRLALCESMYQKLVAAEYQSHQHSEEVKNQSKYRDDIKIKIQQVNEQAGKIQNIKTSDRYTTMMGVYNEVLSQLNTKLTHYSSQWSEVFNLETLVYNVFEGFSADRRYLERTRTGDRIRPILREIDNKRQILKDTICAVNTDMTYGFTTRMNKVLATCNDLVKDFETVLSTEHITHAVYTRIMDANIPTEDKIFSINIPSCKNMQELKDYSGVVKSVLNDAKSKAYRISWVGKFNRLILHKTQSVV